MPKSQNIEKKDAKGVVVESSNLYEFSRDLIINSRKLVYQTANLAMVETMRKVYMNEI